MTADRRTALVLAAGSAATLFAAPALAQRQPPRAERTLSGADLTALNTPDPDLPEMVLGQASARITLIEYASMTCPHCATFHNEVVPQIKTKYVDTGQMRLVFRNFILNVLDAGAAMLARCAPAERFFPLTEAVFAQQRQMLQAQDPVGFLRGLALQAGFTQETFEACLRNQQLLDRLNAARERAAQRFGVNSTPTIYINGQLYRGALRIEEIDAIVAPMLRA